MMKRMSWSSQGRQIEFTKGIVLNKTLLNFFLMIPMISSAQVVQIERPVFDSHRHFHMEGQQAAEKIYSEQDMTVYLFKNAQEKCPMSKSDLSKKLRDSLSDPNSRMNETLSYFFPNFSMNQFNGLRVLFDTFGSLNTLFRGFYIKPSSQTAGMISIDCSPGTLTQLPSVLGHELAHHINAKKNLSPWIDEMVAQIIEIRIRNTFPAVAYFSLATKADLPSFFAREKTFQNSAQYSVNSLFGFWFAQNFGGWEVLSAIPPNTKSLLAFADSARLFPGQSEAQKALLNPRALIRQFAFAMNLNQSLEHEPTLYQVPGWQGFSYASEVQQPGRYSLEPGGSLRVSKRWLNDFTNIPSQSLLEAYRVSRISSAVYLNAVTTEIPENDFTEDYVLLINTSTSLDATIELHPQK